jgi:hypothetical protein
MILSGLELLRAPGNSARLSSFGDRFQECASSRKILMKIFFININTPPPCTNPDLLIRHRWRKPNQYFLLGKSPIANIRYQTAAGLSGES